jgi:murein DD-endopeptidase MepM/ murein hydrolase activator NlpD
MREDTELMATGGITAGSRFRRLALALLACCCLLTVSTLPEQADAAGFGTRVLRLGTKGKDVRALQRALTVLGFATTADGAFGPTTKKNVKKLERKQGWRVDGKVTRKDARRIIKMAAKRRKVAKPVGVYFVSGINLVRVEVTASKAGTAYVDVVDDASGAVVTSIPITFGSGGGAGAAAWDGWDGGAPVGDGTYRMKLGDLGGTGAQVTGGITRPFLMRARAFPVIGAHSFGGAGSRFGAGRGDHIHQGQDVSAACGQHLVAPELSQVSTRAYQAGGAGYYSVLHGLISGTDYVFMHLKKPSWAPVGQTLRAGQQFGQVGTTGSSTGCHLHFERWTAPGWYKGGAPYDPLPELSYWDTYS